MPDHYTIIRNPRETGIWEWLLPDPIDWLRDKIPNPPGFLAPYVKCMLNCTKRCRTEPEEGQTRIECLRECIQECIRGEGEQEIRNIGIVRWGVGTENIQQIQNIGINYWGYEGAGEKQVQHISINYWGVGTENTRAIRNISIVSWAHLPVNGNGNGNGNGGVTGAEAQNITINNWGHIPVPEISGIEFIRPMGAEVWQRGTTEQLMWRVEETPGNAGMMVRIELHRTDYSGVIQAFTTTTDGYSGTYNWNIPTSLPPSNNYYFVIWDWGDLNPYLNDASNVFALV